MKKLLILLTLSILIVGCNSEEPNTTETEVNEIESTNNQVVAQTNEEEEPEEIKESEEPEQITAEVSGDELIGKKEESEFGVRTFRKVKSNINEEHSSGPININIVNITLSDFEHSEQYKDYFTGNEKTAVLINMDVENTSEDTLGIYPDQSTIVTDTKEQKDADLFLSNSIGGDYIGQVIKNGSVIYFLESPAEDINNIKVVIGGAHTDDFMTTYDDIVIEHTFE